MNYNNKLPEGRHRQPQLLVNFICKEAPWTWLETIINLEGLHLVAYNIGMVLKTLEEMSELNDVELNVAPQYI